LTTPNKGEWREVESLLNANSNIVIGDIVLKCFVSMPCYITKAFKYYEHIIYIR